MSATLASIRIKNFALVEDLTWAPGAGFNAVTGETGAGKSVLIGALNLLLGERADKSMVRTGAENCTVEALFETGDPAIFDALLEEAGAEPCEQGRLIIKRQFGASTGRQFVNNSPCNLGLLKRLGDLLVDLHGPHDHQSLFSREEQTRLLDEFAGALEVRSQFISARRRWVELVAERDRIDTEASASEREAELLRHQCAEIEAAEVLPGEEEAIGERHRAAGNARKLCELGASALALLAESETCLESMSGELGRTVREMARLDGRAAPIEERQRELHELLADLSRQVSDYLRGIDDDPKIFAELSARLDVLLTLKRKYGEDLAAVVRFAGDGRLRLAEIEAVGERGVRLDEDIREAAERARALAVRLSAGRKAGAERLTRAVASQLLELGFRRAGFRIELERCAPGAEVPGIHGDELAEFVFAPNPGEAERPLRQIASSGEISRVMLALKCSLAAQDRVSLLVFDEIDANVGGETATRVGKKMRELGAARQVLCITHLPQVAAAASTHFVVEKSVEGGRTFSLLRRLGDEERVGEIARMLGGLGESALGHARSLLASESG